MVVDKQHCVYMLRCGDDSLYTGYTNDLSNRLKKHQEGKGAKYTRGRGPVVLECFEVYDTKQDAMKREYEIKTWSRGKKELWIAEQKAGMQDEDTEKLRR
ncbi:GIY-YIG nuclease family protein [Thalassobacillus hwangdonensis]|uniref:GIY-YIG nuclease family protein n=1 Tax=Thalassobacillus hwangdonensis TaxID=546108 RepID=A0ABW3L951_9BACI